MIQKIGRYMRFTAMGGILSPDCIRKHCNGARQILNKEIEGAEKELFGQKIKVYHVGETIFLYDT